MTLGRKAMGVAGHLGQVLEGLKHPAAGHRTGGEEEEAARLVRQTAVALRDGRAPDLAELNVVQHLALLHGLIETQGIAICKSYAALADLPLGRFRPYDLLVMMVRRAPGSRTDDTGDLPSRAAHQGFAVLPAARSSKVVFIFTGAAQQFGCPLPVIHQWFRGLGASLVYLFDVKGTYYLGGIAGLADTLQGTAVRLRQMVQEMGATSVACIGNSGGGFGALLHAPLVGARRSLAFSPPTVIRESLPAVCEKVPQLRSMVAADGTIGIPDLYRGQSATPPARVYFPADNLHDRDEAAALQGLSGITVSAVPDTKDHNLVPLFVSQDRFSEELLWLTSD